MLAAGQVFERPSGCAAPFSTASLPLSSTFASDRALQRNPEVLDDLRWFSLLDDLEKNLLIITLFYPGGIPIQHFSFGKGNV